VTALHNAEIAAREVAQLTGQNDRAAQIRWDKQGDTPVTRTVLTIARGNLDHALSEWQKGTS
jgi:hypothetical protein